MKLITTLLLIILCSVSLSQNLIKSKKIFYIKNNNLVIKDTSLFIKELKRLRAGDYLVNLTFEETSKTDENKWNDAIREYHQSIKTKPSKDSIYEVIDIKRKTKLIILDTTAFVKELEILIVSDKLMNLMYKDGTISSERKWNKLFDKYIDVLGVDKD